jgi:SCP-2 sterol transfer family
VPPVLYLSREWMDAARGALAADTGLKAATAEVRLTLEQVVTGVPAEVGPDATGSVRWHVRVDQGEVALAAGAAGPDGPDGPDGTAAGDGADVRFTTDYATAAAIASGRLSAQRAFLDGRLRVGGDVGMLGRNQRAFAAVDDALAAVRAATTFPAP